MADPKTPATVDVVTPLGQIAHVPAGQLGAYLAQNPAARRAHGEDIADDIERRRLGGAAGFLGSAGAGLGRGLTMGLSDVALEQAGLSGDLRAMQRLHPLAGNVGEAAGVGLGILATGGAGAAVEGAEGAAVGARGLLRAAAAPWVATDALGAAAGRLGGGGVLGLGLRGAVEGAVTGGLGSWGESAQQEQDLTAEAVGGSMLAGAAIGGGIGLGLGVLTRGGRRAARALGEPPPLRPLRDANELAPLVQPRPGAAPLEPIAAAAAARVPSAADEAVSAAERKVAGLRQPQGTSKSINWLQKEEIAAAEKELEGLRAAAKPTEKASDVIHGLGVDRKAAAADDLTKGRLGRVRGGLVNASEEASTVPGEHLRHFADPVEGQVRRADAVIDVGKKIGVVRDSLGKALPKWKAHEAAIAAAAKEVGLTHEGIEIALDKLTKKSSKGGRAVSATKIQTVLKSMGDGGTAAGVQDALKARIKSIADIRTALAGAGKELPAELAAINTRAAQMLDEMEAATAAIVSRRHLRTIERLGGDASAAFAGVAGTLIGSQFGDNPLGGGLIGGAIGFGIQGIRKPHLLIRRLAAVERMGQSLSNRIRGAARAAPKTIQAGMSPEVKAAQRLIGNARQGAPALEAKLPGIMAPSVGRVLGHAGRIIADAVSQMNPAPSSVGEPPAPPSRAEVLKATETIDAIGDPAAALKDAMTGHMSVYAGPAIKRALPATYALMQQTIIATASDLAGSRRRMAYATRIALGAGFEVPLDVAIRPESIAKFQALYILYGNQQGGKQAPNDKKKGKRPRISSAYEREDNLDADPTGEHE